MKTNYNVVCLSLYINPYYVIVLSGMQLCLPMFYQGWLHHVGQVGHGPTNFLQATEQ